MAKPTFDPRPGEEIFAQKVGCDCWKMPQVSGKRQISGRLYMTDQRVAFLASGLIGTASVSWEIEMKDIASIRTCITPPFFPFGIEIAMRDGTVYLLAILKRNKYFTWLNEHIS